MVPLKKKYKSEKLVSLISLISDPQNTDLGQASKKSEAMDLLGMQFQARSVALNVYETVVCCTAGDRKQA